MKARDIMIQHVFAAQKDDMVRDVLRRFSQQGIGGMPIIDNDRRVVGYISDGDIMRYLGRHYGTGIPPYLTFGTYFMAVDPELMEPEQGHGLRDQVMHICNQKAMAIGRKKVISVSPDDDIGHVADLLSRKNIKKVPVIQDGILVGIISRGDVVRAVVQNFVSA